MVIAVEILQPGSEWHNAPTRTMPASTDFPLRRRDRTGARHHHRGRSARAVSLRNERSAHPARAARLAVGRRTARRSRRERRTPGVRCGDASDTRCIDRARGCHRQRARDLAGRGVSARARTAPGSGLPAGGGEWGRGVPGAARPQCRSHAGRPPTRDRTMTGTVGPPADASMRPCAGTHDHGGTESTPLFPSYRSNTA